MGDRRNVDFWKFAAPASHGNHQKSTTADWVRMVEIIQAMKKRGELEKRWEPSEDFLANGFDVIRARRLSSLI